LRADAAGKLALPCCAECGDEASTPDERLALELHSKCVLCMTESAPPVEPPDWARQRPKRLT
jgi:hypothetical protein